MEEVNYIEDLEASGTIEGGSNAGGLLDGVDPERRNISLKVAKEPDGEVDQTWVIIHGWDSSPEGSNIAGLIQKTAATAGENDRVLVLDWSEASNNSGSVGDNAPLGNGIAATWIAPTAEETIGMLEEFGIDSTNADQKLNLVGHSLGSFVSAEIARTYQTGESRQGEPVTTANNKGVRTITALDPASNNGLIGGGYDVDYRASGRQSPANFSEVSEFSRSFVGDKSAAGNKELADNADEAYLLDFGSANLNFGEHGRVVQTFTNILDRDNKIGDLLGFDSYQSLDALPTAEFGEKKKASFSYKGIINVNSQNGPTKLTAQSATDGRDAIVVGDSQADEILGSAGNDSLFGEGNNDILIGDTNFLQAGNDTLNGGSRNDVLEGRRGDDVLIGGIENGQTVGENSDLEDNDRLDGGRGEDTAVFSDDFENYEYNIDPETKIVTFTHARGTQTDGTDTLENIESAQFSDRTVPIPLNSIEGAEIQLEVFAPNRSNPISESVIATVEENIEFTELPSLALPGSSVGDADIDIIGGIAGEASIRYEINDLDFTQFPSYDFNGYVLRDIADEIPAIENVTIDESANTLGLASSDVTFSENTIEMNVEGLTFETGDGFLLNVEFADA